MATKDCLIFSSISCGCETGPVSESWVKLKTLKEIEIENANTSHSFYNGVAYYEVSKTGVSVMIAHSGGYFRDENENFLCDMANSKRFHPKMLSTALWYVSQVIVQVTSQLGSAIRYKITHTGYSLGGFIAHLCAVRDPFSTSVAFDSPGIRSMLNSDDQCSKLKSRLVTYLTSPNMVNTCLRQVGELRQLTAFKNFACSDSCEFVINFSDFGFGIHSEKEIHIETSREQENHLVADLELGHTYSVHNLVKFNELRNWDYEVVTGWPCAEVEVIYDVLPAVASTSTSELGCADMFAAFSGIFNLFCGAGGSIGNSNSNGDEDGLLDRDVGTDNLGVGSVGSGSPKKSRNRVWHRTSLVTKGSDPEELTGAVALKYKLTSRTALLSSGSTVSLSNSISTPVESSSSSSRPFSISASTPTTVTSTTVVSPAPIVSNSSIDQPEGVSTTASDCSPTLVAPAVTAVPTSVATVSE